ncbi:MAG: hypothetical protein O3A92_15350 [Verrucomicrobia bacterium]|nr:hypothetical protein [Verrucomicrobiota bacterium]
MGRTILCLGLALLVSGPVQGIDAAPPPKVKTLAWTMKIATESHVENLDLRNAVASGVVEFLDASEGSLAGFYLNLDAAGVADRLHRRVTIVEPVGLMWIEVVARLADQLDADVVISPGKVKLVPREEEVE